MDFCKVLSWKCCGETDKDADWSNKTSDSEDEALENSEKAIKIRKSKKDRSKKRRKDKKANRKVSVSSPSEMDPKIREQADSLRNKVLASISQNNSIKKSV
jgi:K+-transporting ATPase c subunit